MHEDEMDSALAKRRISQFVDWAVKAMVMGCFIFIWRMYEAQQDFIRKQDLTDAKIVQIADNTNNRITQLEKEVARIEGNMVTMETLKRVELYMELLFVRNGIDKKVDLTSSNLKK